MKNVNKTTVAPVRRPISGGTRQGEREARYRYWRVGRTARDVYPLEFWVSVAGEYHGKPGFFYESSEWEESNWTQVYYFTGGRAAIYHGGKPLQAAPGQLLFLPPGEQTRTRSREAVRFHWAALQGRRPALLGADPGALSLDVGPDEILVDSFVAMRESLILQRPGHVLNAIASFYRILGRVEEITGAFSASTFPPKSVYPEAVRNALLFLEEQLAVPFNSGRTSDAAGVSASHLRALFERWLGESPKRYHTRLRMEKARFLLKELQLSVSEVSLQLGFRDRSHFSKVFKRFTGVSPGRFKKDT